VRSLTGSATALTTRDHHLQAATPVPGCRKPTGCNTMKRWLLCDIRHTASGASPGAKHFFTISTDLDPARPVQASLERRDRARQPGRGPCRPL